MGGGGSGTGPRGGGGGRVLKTGGRNQFARQYTTSIPGGSCHKYHLCHDKSFVFFVATKVLSPQAYFSRDKRRVLSRRTRVYRDKSKLDDTQGL